MHTAATLRRPAVLLGTILVALTLTGSAGAQTLGGVLSTVDEVTEPVTKAVEPVTKAVEPVTKAAEPVTKTAANATEPAEESAPAPVTRTVEQATQPVVATVARTTRRAASAASSAEPVVRAAASTVDRVATRATRSVEPLATAATRAVTGTLRAANAALPTETQALLGPLVETVDAQAEELTGSLLGPTATGLGDTVRTVTGVLAPSQGSPPGPPGIAGGTPPPAEEPAQVAPGAVDPERTATRPGNRHGTDRGAPLVQPPTPPAPLSLAAVTRPGERPAGETESPAGFPAPPAPSSPAAPAAPGSGSASSTASSAALAVLAGLFALALASLLGRLLPWSDTIRPLAFVSPPERPG